MTKVCHITSAHGPEDVRIFHKECISLVEAGYDVYLVEQGDSYDKNGVHIVGFGEPEQTRLLRMTRSAHRAYTKALALDCDLYHFHDPELLPYGEKLKRNGKVVVFDSHENTLASIAEKEWIPVPLRAVGAKGFERLQARVSSQIDAVIVPSPNLASLFQPICRRVETVTNYPIFDDATPSSIFEGHSLVFAGGISEQWNILNIMSAMKSFPECSLTLCGPSDSSYLAKLQMADGWERVNYLGRVPHSDVAPLLASGDIGVAVLSYGFNTAGKQGTMGNTKLFEEMMAGLPVICTDFELWEPIIKNHKCGLLVDPGNPFEIEAAIRWLLEHPREAKAMGENGRKAVRDHYNWDVESQKLIALYDELV